VYSSVNAPSSAAINRLASLESKGSAAMDTLKSGAEL
jgi:hypothetical protein